MIYDNRQHLCGWLEQLSRHPFLEIDVIEKSGIWSISYKSFASKEDVMSGEANNVGELLGGFSLAIQFCPFCGLQLTGIGSR